MLGPLLAVLLEHVAVHHFLGDCPSAVWTNDLLVFLEFHALALVVDGHPTVASLAENVVLAALGMALVKPFAASGALEALGAMGQHPPHGRKGLSTVRTGVL